MVVYDIRSIIRGAYSPWISWLCGVIATYGDRVNVDGTGCTYVWVMNRSSRLEGSLRLDMIGFCDGNDGNELCSQSFRNLFVYKRYYF